VACPQKKENKKDKCTMLKVLGELWKEIRIVLPKEKPPKTIGRSIVPFRKVLWYPIHFKNWMPVENVASWIRIRFDMPQAISGVD